MRRVHWVLVASAVAALAGWTLGGCYGQKKQSERRSETPADTAGLTASSDSAFVPYWASRGIVYIQAVCDSTGRVIQATPYEGDLTGPAADSLVALVRGSTYSPEDLERRETGQFDVIVPFALNRRAKGFGGREGPRLAAAVRDTLREGSLKPWYDLWRAVDPGFTLDDFTSTGPQPIPRAEWPHFLDTPEITAKAGLGLLRVSSSGKWVLDPYAGTTFPGGQPAADVDRGFSLSEKATGKRIFHVVAPREDMWLAAWTGPDTFVIVGMAAVLNPKARHGRDLDVWAPAVWIGDADAGTLETFHGVPVDPRETREVDARKTKLLEGAFPNVNWAG
jgi:hypothetical protein